MAIKINVCDVPINFKLDTGSDANILSWNMLKLIQPLSEVRNRYITMRAYNGGCIPSIREAKVTLSYKNNIIESIMQITMQFRQLILGAIDCENRNIVKRVNEVVTDSVADTLSGSYIPLPPGPTITEDDVEMHVCVVISNMMVTTEKWKEIANKSQKMKHYKK